MAQLTYDLTYLFTDGIYVDSGELTSLFRTIVFDPSTKTIGVSSIGDMATYLGNNGLIASSLIGQPNGVARLNASGQLVGPIIPRINTAAAINAITLADGEIAVTSDTDEVRKGDGTTPGGLHVSGVIHQTITPTASTTYEVPRGKDVVLHVPDWTVTPGNPMFKLNPAMQAGDRLRISILASTGIDLAGAWLMYFGDPESKGQEDYYGLMREKGTPDAITSCDNLQGLTITTDGVNTFLDMTLSGVVTVSDPVLYIEYPINLTLTGV